MLVAVTIADHCLALLAEQSPRTPEELAEACAAAGVTRARDPVASVKSALLSRGDEAPVLPDGRYGFTLRLLEGCWLTTRQRNGDRLVPSFDLGLLQRLVASRPVPLATGGSVESSSFADGLSGPPGWLPHHADGALIGVRLSGGVLDVRPVVLDADASARGTDLAARLRARVSSRGSWWPAHGLGREHEVWRALVQLVAQEPKVLAVPVAPLSELLPDMAHRPEAAVVLGDPVVLSLPVALRERLQAHSDGDGVPLPRWLTDRLEELARDGTWWGRRNRYDAEDLWTPGYDASEGYGWADAVPLGDGA